MSSDKCFKCGRRGHWARDCDKGSGTREGPCCFSCGGIGHFQKDCPNQVCGARCHCCGKQGHMQCQGKQQLKPSTICFRCGKHGHIAPECRAASSKSGKTEHLAPDCPKNYRQGQKGNIGRYEDKKVYSFKQSWNENGNEVSLSVVTKVKKKKK